MATRYTRRVILVVTAGDREQARADALAAVPGSGPGLFTVGLVAPGTPRGTAPSHSWCSWKVTPEEAAALRTRFGSGNARGRRMFWGIAGDRAETVEGETEVTPGEVLRTLGLTRPATPRDAAARAVHVR
jgi:hypothetical protein